MNSNLKVTQFLQHIFKPAYQKLLSSCLLLLSPPSSQPEGCGLWITNIQEKIEKEETKSFFLVGLIQRNLDEGHLWTSSPPFFETTGQGAGWGAWIDLIWLTLLFLVIIQFTSFSVFDQTIKIANGTIKLRVGFGLYISSLLNKASSQLLFTHKLAKIQHQSLDQTLVLISPPKFSPKSSPKFSFKSSTILHPSLELANIGQLELELSNYLHQPHQVYWLNWLPEGRVKRPKVRKRRLALWPVETARSLVTRKISNVLISFQNDPWKHSSFSPLPCPGATITTTICWSWLLNHHYNHHHDYHYYHQYNIISPGPGSLLSRRSRWSRTDRPLLKSVRTVGGKIIIFFSKWLKKLKPDAQNSGSCVARSSEESYLTFGLQRPLVLFVRALLTK